MDADPVNWTLADVQLFFRQDAAKYIIDRPNSQLPHLEPFLQTLADCDVNGASLLDAVEMPVLREDFGITNLNIRGTIMHCIKKLRAQSHVHRSQTLRPETPASLSFLPRLAVGPETPIEAVKSVEAETGENVRSGQYQVQDAHGRKRRKLDLTNVQPENSDARITPPTPPEGNLRLDRTGFLPDAALPIDELFYGPTAFGNEIRDLPPLGNILVGGDAGEAGEYNLQTADTDAANDNFQFTSQGKLLAEAGYAHSRMRYFLSNAEQLELRRRDRIATGILPYRDGVQSKVRSALVVQVGKDDEEYIAVREQASLLQGGYDYTGLEKEGSTGEWDFLLQRHKQGSNDDELPVYGESETGERSITDSETGTTRDGEAQASEETEEPALVRDRISDVLEEYVANHIAEWHEKTLPRTEEKKAWSVWKKMKRSRTLRDLLISTGYANIEQLSQRLNKFKEDFLGREWSSEGAITKVCAVLDPTIDDIEEQKWMISVWQRRKEPAHVVHHNKNNQGIAKAPATGDVPRPSFMVHPDDRMSVSPSPATRPEDDDGEVFHTPEGSLTPGADLDGFDASDEMSLELNHPEESETERSEDEGMPDDLEDHDEDESPNETVITSSPPRPSAAPGSAKKFIDRLRDVAMSDSAGGQGASSEDELPPLSSFRPKRMKHTPRPETPKKTRTSNISTQPIDLTISSDSAGPSSKKSNRIIKLSPAARKARANYDFSSAPQDATAAQVDSWEYSELSARNDRQRILIKMLYENGSDLRNELHQLFTESRKAFRVELCAAMRRHNEHTAADTVMDYCAAIAMAWYTSDSDIMHSNQNVPWDKLLNDAEQINQFLSMLAKYLKIRDSKLFVAATPNGKSATRPHPSSVTLISSSDAEGVTQDTPRKKRKKEVQASQAAIKSRRTAHERQARFQAVLESQQAAGSSQIAAMDGSVASMSDLTVNPTRENDESPLFIDPVIAAKMKAHQIAGVQFMWREITAVEEGVGAQGCLLAHTMGLGKTMQTIALLVALVEASESGHNSIRNQLPAHLRPTAVREKLRERQLRILVLCPPGLIQNWLKELEQWAPNKLRNVFPVEASGKTDSTKVIKDWHKVGGVLLLGYTMLRIFVGRDSKKQLEAGTEQLGEVTEMLLQGPEVVVADEAHSLKNPKSKTSEAAGKFRTQTRIALTGTPMSNDVDEIFALISWVAPEYLGDHSWFTANFAEPIKAGTYGDSTRSEKRKSMIKLQALHKNIGPKVDRADITALRGSLKSKTEFVITVALTEAQTTLYKRLIAALLEGGRNREASQVTIFSWLGVLMLLTNHPDSFRRKLLTPAPPRKTNKSKKGAVEDTSADSDTGSNAATSAATSILDTTAEQDVAAQAVTEDPGDMNLFALGFTQDMVDTILQGFEHQDMDPHLSGKMPVLLDILDFSFRCGDKVLVFSGSIPTIDYVCELLKSRGIDFGRIDGQTAPGKRLQIIEDFHSNDYEVLIVSTRAGGVGLNIQGANRVVILDFSFNPAWEEQAIGRAYRLGQPKPVYVYRFVAGGTFESNIRNKQLFKTSLTQRVVDKKNPRRHAQRNTREYLYDPKHVPQDEITQWIEKDQGVLDVILQRQDGGKDMLIRNIQTTEILEEDAQDEPLDEDEKRQVNEEIELGRQRGRYGGAGLPPMSTAATAAVMAAASMMPNGRTMGPPAATQAINANRPNGPVSSTQAQPNGPSAPKAAAPPSTAPAVQRRRSGQSATPSYRPLQPGQ